MAPPSPTLVALHRFGLGPKPGVVPRITAAPKRSLRAELDQVGIARITAPGLPTYTKACFEAESSFHRADALRELEIGARFDKHRAVEIGFVERLVLFWSNHFAVSVKKAAAVRGTIGQMERDVIRKHVLGRFADMLVGVVRHPAMIAYLDNSDSIGPNSRIGLRNKTGLNNNLAREILELHTVGSGYYTETDVYNLSKILTGWSHVRGYEVDNGMHEATNEIRGQYIFRPDWHEPGSFDLIGKTYAPEGERQGIRVLADLAVHPGTAEHVAYKLVRHFVTDAPKPATVDVIKSAFLRSRGNLKTVSLALLNLPEAWSTPLQKLRTPYECLVAEFRALGLRYRSGEIYSVTNILGSLHHPIWESPTPEGFSDETQHWLRPDGMRVRLDAAYFAAKIYGERFTGSVPLLATQLYGSLLSRETMNRIASEGDNRRALTILFCCPEFQRR